MFDICVCVFVIFADMSTAFIADATTVNLNYHSLLFFQQLHEDIAARGRAFSQADIKTQLLD